MIFKKISIRDGPVVGEAMLEGFDIALLAWVEILNHQSQHLVRLGREAIVCFFHLDLQLAIGVFIHICNHHAEGLILVNLTPIDPVFQKCGKFVVICVVYHC